MLHLFYLVKITAGYCQSLEYKDERKMYLQRERNSYYI